MGTRYRTLPVLCKRDGLRGMNAEEIIEYFYPGCTLEVPDEKCEVKREKGNGRSEK